MHPLYQDACAVLSLLDQRKGTLRRLCLAPSVRNKKATLALASGTLRYSKILESCLREVGIHQRQKEFHSWLLKILVYESIIGQRKLKGGGAASRVIKDNAEALQKALAAFKIQDVEQITAEFSIPRYARINTLKTDVEAVIDRIKADGYQLRSFDEVANAKTCKGQEIKIFAKDELLSDVILFPHDEDLHDHPLVASACLRLQDKASCFPAHVLIGGSGVPIRCALDACSAPGNKTTHLAALMGPDNGRVLAIELDQRRSAMLRETVRQLGATNVDVMSRDFLGIDTTQPPFCDVEGILLDPSCSGSGIIGRGHEAAQRFPAGDGNRSAAEQARLRSLSRFQTRALCHALSFPSVRRVVYSTCSLHREENEDVVAAGLAHARGRFRLEQALPAWPRRGDASGGLADADMCVRVCPPADRAQGFFVACFVRCAPPPAHPDSPPPPPRPPVAAASDTAATNAATSAAHKKGAGSAVTHITRQGGLQPATPSAAAAGSAPTAPAPLRPAAGRLAAGHGRRAALWNRLRRFGRRGLLSVWLRNRCRR